jgi:Na+/melibiose symporter-like transporter
VTDRPIPLFEPKAQYARLRARIDARLRDVLAHGRYVLGPEVAELETALARRAGVGHAVAVGNGTDALLITLVCIKFVQGVGVVQALITFGSMVADIVDEHELKTGKRQEGIFFASVSFSGKFTTGIGNVVGGIALDLISWPRGVAIQSAADVPPETITWLGLVYGPIVAGFAVVSVWCYSKHRLDRHRHKEIVAELEIRRRAAVQPEQAAGGGG